jgi:hypothetical protein
MANSLYLPCVSQALSTEYSSNRGTAYYLNNYTLWTIRGFRGGDYEECRLLGYKNPVRTSQEKHHIPATESSQLKLCKI